ncbi:MAG: GTP cyclohydrolase II RibA [Wolbachia endosymbiont of Xenopsylla cheopis]
MTFYNKEKNSVERALSEIRRGMPIIVFDHNSYILFAAVEILEEDLFEKYKIITSNIYVVITANKLQHMTKDYDIGKEKFFRLQIDNFEDLSDILNWHKQQNYQIQNIKKHKALDEYAISLLKMTELLPLALVVDMEFKNDVAMQKWCSENDVIYLKKSNIINYKQNNDLYEVCKTPLLLSNCKEVSVIVYRTIYNSKEHYAIIIGKPDYNEPLVRVHSSCYTGDLLKSLSCDCYNQLHDAIAMMTNTDGGIILYLNQDGRGIGLINKLRAYSLQMNYKFDTVDANAMLGFDDDERDFVHAANILKKLDIVKICLLTNNPKKVIELERYGIQIIKRVELITQYNQYNDSYIQTKFKRLGHIEPK